MTLDETKTRWTECRHVIERKGAFYPDDNWRPLARAVRGFSATARVTVLAENPAVVRIDQPANGRERERSLLLEVR